MAWDWGLNLESLPTLLRRKCGACPDLKDLLPSHGDLDTANQILDLAEAFDTFPQWEVVCVCSFHDTLIFSSEDVALTSNVIVGTEFEAHTENMKFAQSLNVESSHRQILLLPQPL